MALPDQNNEYSTTSDSPERTQTANLPQDNDYRTTTNPLGLDFNKGDVANAIPSLGNLPAYQSVSNALALAEAGLQSAVKITMSEIGFWRQVISYGGSVTTDQTDPDVISSKPFILTGTYDYGRNQNNYKVEPSVIQRTNFENECVFKIGEYFLPLSFNYRLHAEKITALSQLVDGPEIIQKIGKRPKTIDLTLRVEKDFNKINTDSGTNNHSAMAFVQGETLNDPLDPDGAYVQLAQLATVLRELYEDNDVFLLENTTLNNDHGFNWVFMESYDYRPNMGQSIVDISMRLRQIDMTENAIIIGQSTIRSDVSVGDTGVFRL